MSQVAPLALREGRLAEILKAIQNLIAAQDDSFDLTSFTLAELISTLPSHPQIYCHDPHIAAEYRTRYAGRNERPAWLFRHSGERKDTTTWIMISNFHYHWVVLVFFETEKVALLVNSIPKYGESQACETIQALLRDYEEDLGSPWTIVSKVVFLQKDSENCGPLAFVFVRTLVRWLIRKPVQEPLQIDMLRLRESLALRLTLRYRLDKDLARFDNKDDTVWKPAQRRLSIDELMKAIQVGRLILPESQDDEDNDLQILDPAQHADLVQYRVLGGEEFAPYAYTQFRDVAFEFMMTQVAAKWHTVVRLLTFHYNDQILRESDTPRQLRLKNGETLEVKFHS